VTVIVPYHCSLPKVTGVTYSEHDFALAQLPLLEFPSGTETTIRSVNRGADTPPPWTDSGHNHRQFARHDEAQGKHDGRSG
jgi:hypothetical protein